MSILRRAVLTRVSELWGGRVGWKMKKEEEGWKNLEGRSGCDQNTL